MQRHHQGRKTHEEIDGIEAALGAALRCRGNFILVFTTRGSIDLVESSSLANADLLQACFSFHVTQVSLSTGLILDCQNLQSYGGLIPLKLDLSTPDRDAGATPRVYESVPLSCGQVDDR